MLRDRPDDFAQERFELARVGHRKAQQAAPAARDRFVDAGRQHGRGRDHLAPGKADPGQEQEEEQENRGGRTKWPQPLTAPRHRSEEHTSELQSLMRISYAVFCLKKKTIHNTHKETKPNNEKKTNTIN